MAAVTERVPALLATAEPSPGDRRLALLAISASVVCFAIMVPFARLPTLRITAFVPAYESALAMADLITAVILFGQFATLRRLSILIAASAYLFDACLVVLHVLSFPGVFSPGGLLGGGVQTTAWLYVFWHGGFPALIFAYGLLAGSGRDVMPPWLTTRTAICGALATVAALAAAMTLASMSADNLLPTIMVGADYSRMVWTGISPALLVLTALAIATLWRRRWTSLLDMWLFAVLWVWICDVSLSAVVGSSRFDLGWYGGRLFGLLAGGFVLSSLLVESTKLYGQLAGALAETEARNAELISSRNSLAQAQRLDAVGQLTGGIAHDFNNLLTAIMGALELICRKADDSERVVRLAENARKAAARGARLVSQLLSFSRKQNLRPEVLNPNSVLLEFESLASRAAGEAVRLAFNLDPGVHPVHVDATEFQAAILNLVTNARDALPDGGDIKLESRNVRLDGTDTPEVPPGDYVLLAVSDSGTGMEPETQAKAFEPFFTTKPVGQGSGLGLSQVFGFVRSSGGHVAVTSSLGVGTTVSMYLPRSTAAPGQTAPLADATSALRPASAGECVLAVEDDAHVIATTAESLRDLGYSVLTAETAQEALALLRQGTRVDILFSDVVMPGGMNGVQLAVEARRLRPGLRVLLMSGYTGATLDAHAVPHELPLLGKPYGREELAHKLRVVLRER